MGESSNPQSLPLIKGNNDDDGNDDAIAHTTPQHTNIKAEQDSSPPPMPTIGGAHDPPTVHRDEAAIPDTAASSTSSAVMMDNNDGGDNAHKEGTSSVSDLSKPTTKTTVGIPNEEDKAADASSPISLQGKAIKTEATVVAETATPAVHNNNNDNKDVNEDTPPLDPYDEMADIAANAHIQSRRSSGCDTATANATEGNGNDSAAVASNDAIIKSMMPASKPTIVTASMSNCYVPPRLQRAGSLESSCNFDTNDRNRRKKFVDWDDFGGSSSCNTDKKNHGASVQMLSSVGLDCGDDGVLRIDQCKDGNDDRGSDAVRNKADGTANTRGNGERNKNNTAKATYRSIDTAKNDPKLNFCVIMIPSSNRPRQPRLILAVVEAAATARMVAIATTVAIASHRRRRRLKARNRAPKLY